MTAATQTAANVITITSAAFKNQGAIPKKYGCSGESISPPLAFSGIPSATKICRASVSHAEAKVAFHRMSRGDASDVNGQRTRRENGSERVKRPGTNAMSTRRLPNRYRPVAC